MKYWISCNKFTVQVRVIDGIIVKTPPLVRKFKGQKIENLISWATKLGDIQIVKWEEDEILSRT